MLLGSGKNLAPLVCPHYELDWLKCAPSLKKNTQYLFKVLPFPDFSSFVLGDEYLSKPFSSFLYTCKNSYPRFLIFPAHLLSKSGLPLFFNLPHLVSKVLPFFNLITDILKIMSSFLDDNWNTDENINILNLEHKTVQLCNRPFVHNVYAEHGAKLNSYPLNAHNPYPSIHSLHIHVPM